MYSCTYLQSWDEVLEAIGYGTYGYRLQPIFGYFVSLKAAPVVRVPGRISTNSTS